MISLSKYMHWFGLFLILVITFWMFFPVRSQGWFLMDDAGQVIKNSAVVDGDLYTMFTSATLGMYTPMSNLLSSIVYAIKGDDPGAFHGMSLLFHLANSALLFLLLNKVLQASWYVAALNVLMFSLHPLIVESVAWFSAFSTLLSSFFGILTLCILFFYISKGKKFWLYLSYVLFTLALLSKVQIAYMAIVYMAVLWNEKYTMRNLLKEVAPFFLLSLIFGLMAFKVRYGGTMVDYGYPLFWLSGKYALQSMESIAYANWLVYFTEYPWRLQFLDYALTIIMALASVISLWYINNKFLRIGLLIIFGAIAVTLPLWHYQISFFSARYMYMPLMGVAMILATVSKMNLSFVIISMVLLANVLFTRENLTAWSSDEGVFERQYSIAPSCAMRAIQSNFPIKKGEYERAQKMLNEALSMAQRGRDTAVVYFYQGILLKKQHNKNADKYLYSPLTRYYFPEFLDSTNIQQLIK